MRSILLLVFFALLILTSSFSNYFSKAEKKVGVYDRDSLLDAMPNYHPKLDSFTNYALLLNKTLFSIDTVFASKQNKFNSDSLKWSPLMKEFKRREILELAQRITDFYLQATEDAYNMKSKLLQPFDDSITVAANDIAKKKKMEMVLDKKEMIGYHTANTTVKIVNVTRDMRKRLEIN